MRPITFLSCMVVIILLTGLSPITADSQFQVYKHKCTGDTDMFDIKYASISCYGGCHYGSDGTFSATFTIGDDISTSSPYVTVKVLNIETYNGTVDICNDGTLSNADGYYCPSPGTYSTHRSTSIPGSKDSLYSKYWPWLVFSVYATFDFDGDAEVECQFKVEGKYTYSSGSIFSGSALLFIGAYSTRMRRKRRIACESPDTPSACFIEMGDEIKGTTTTHRELS